MANFNGAVAALLAEGATPDPGFLNGTVRVSVDSITYAAQASGSTLTLGKLPKGAVVLGGALITSVTTDTATLAVGVSGTAAKYKAAAAVTTADVPQLFGKAAALGAALTAEETIIVTTGAAALPASGTLTCVIFFAAD